jgi:hypothetical protein
MAMTTRWRDSPIKKKLLPIPQAYIDINKISTQRDLKKTRCSQTMDLYGFRRAAG